VRRSFAKADRVLSVSAAGAAVLEARLGRGDVLVVPNAAPAAIHVEASANGDRPAGRELVEVLYVGGFANPAKGGAVMARAVEALARAEAPAIAVTLAGPGVPPSSIQAAVSANGDRVRWRGWLEEADKQAALAEADIVVLPSLSEGLPIALLEAMVAGKAIVAARTGGMPEVITDGDDGLMVDPGDADALAAAIVDLAGDEDRRAQLGARAGERAARLNHEEVFGRLERLYAELAGPDVARRRRWWQPAPPIANRSRAALFLGYHSVAPDGPPFTSVTPELFERQLHLLRQLGYCTGNQESLTDLMRGQRPDRPVCFVSFDDGFEDNLAVALPLLQTYGFRATVFVLPPLVDGGLAMDWPEVADRQRSRPDVMRSMDWAMVERLVDAGMTIGSHTLSHPHLRDLDDERLRQELSESRERIRNRVGTCDQLAYPFGEWDARVARAAADAGYAFAFTLPFEEQRTADALSIPRLVVDHRDSAPRFLAKISPPGRRLLFSDNRRRLRNLRDAGRGRGRTA
jgi:peptidoglycan/xylan/chitin deacetylase (PgdA/CDA1 family)